MYCKSLVQASSSGLLLAILAHVLLSPVPAMIEGTISSGASKLWSYVTAILEGRWFAVCGHYYSHADGCGRSRKVWMRHSKLFGYDVNKITKYISIPSYPCAPSW
jgi:hypothetical protein